MATGTGTQGNPYIVTNVAEFREACTQLNAYVKLANNIDCDEYPEWNTLNCTCAEVDFDGKSLKKMYIQQNQIGLSSGYEGHISTITLFKNGKILDMYEKNAKAFLQGGRYVNMSLSIYEATSQRIIEGSFMELCNTSIYAQRLSYPNASWFKQYSYSDLLKNSRFYIEGRMNAGQIASTYNANVSNKYIQGCLFEGSLNCSKAEGSFIFLDGAITDTVWAVDTTTVPNDREAALADAADTTNIYQNDICASTFDAKNALQGNTEEIRDPGYNNSIGFTVVVK
jgi:hypothetical protein